MKVIDAANWPRKSQFEFFRSLPAPHFSVTSNLDVTNLVAQIKTKDISAFNACLYCIMGAANAVPELRMRFRENTVIEHEVVHVSTTVPIDNSRFAFCSIKFVSDWPQFNARCIRAIEKSKQQTELREHIGDSDEWIFLSCLPWMSFTALSNPNSGPDDCIPRISWGKFHRQGSDWLMPVSVQVHHALVDGIHLGKFYEVLAENIVNLKA